MSKVIEGSINLIAVPLDCGHTLKMNCDSREPNSGEEVDCPVCAEKAKDIKAARLHELNELRAYFPLTAGNHYEGMQKHITERIAEVKHGD